MKRRYLLAFVVTTLGIAGLGPIALAGPPLVCAPFETDSSPSLPWGGPGWHESRADYDTSRLAADTLALLQPDTPVIVRMETLRRSAVYGTANQKAFQAVFDGLAQRMKQATGRSIALAQFDFGYFVETVKQALPGKKNTFSPPTVDGYALVKQAIDQTKSPEMEFAAALITARGFRDASQNGHLRRAVAGATEGSLLARNLVSHFGHLGRDLSTLRASMND